MSVISSVDESIKANGVDTYDSGDDWEIGLGNLIINLDADLEKDQRKLEMNRVLSIKSNVKRCEDLAFSCATTVLDGLTNPSAQPPSVARGNACKESKKFKVKRSNSSNVKDKILSLDTLYGIPKVCIGKRQESQGRLGEATEMNSAADQENSKLNTSDVTISCAKGKEEKRGKNHSRTLKRERDTVRTRKEKQGDALASLDFSGVRASENDCAVEGEENPCHSEDSEMGDSKGGVGARIMGSAIVVNKIEEIDAPARTQKTLQVRTRSVGTNTQEPGKASDAAQMGPCQPGTSVNLEGIVWHETEEGVLVVNVTWRKRTYVGTLLDCTKHDWAPPRFCDSPTTDAETQGGRGRSKRMRLAIPEQAIVEPVLPKVRALPHKRRGVGMSSKGRRGSLNLLSNCRTPPYYTEEELKTSPLSQGKRKIKAPADLDLTLVTEDIKNGNGKRIRAKSRSAPSTPQGKSDPVFLDQACPSPMLIDCPHPNCNKKYKHINGLRYHQSHAHLDTDRKQEFEVENEERLTDEEEGGPVRGLAFSCTEATPSSSKKAISPPKLGALGPSKGRKMMLNNEPGLIMASKSRRHAVTKEGPADDLSNLPIISNMTVVLENCLIADRSSSVEMPKLEAEDVIDKREVDDLSKKEMGKAEKCSSKARAGRFIVTPPAPPKLIAIPTTTFSANSAEASCHHSSPTVALTKAKSLSLKPIKPKLDMILQPNLPSSTLATCKEGKRKDKQRLKDRHCKDIRSTKSEHVHVKMEDSKGIGKDFSISLLKEHLSKQEVSNGPNETQESRMASIRAEADKVYTFTDNAPSPSIGGCSRLDSSTLANGEGPTSKTNSPAYSDISDAADDGGSDGRLNTKLKVNAATEPNPGHSANARVVPGALKEAQSSPLYHGYDSYCLQGFVHAGQANPSTFPKVSAAYDGKTKKDDLKEVAEEFKITDSADTKKKDICPSGTQSQLQMAITDTQTALAQSLYYGQYSRSIKVDQKLLTLSAGSHSRAPVEAGSEDMQQNKQKGPQAVRELELREQQREDVREVPLTGVISKGVNTVKSSGSKVGHPYLELEKQQVKSALITMMKDQRLEPEELRSGKELTEQIPVDSNVSHVNDCESLCWARPYPAKYATLLNQEISKGCAELHSDKAKDLDAPLESGSKMGAELLNKRPEALGNDQDDAEKTDDQDASGEVTEELKSTTLGSEASALSPQQSYVQYQHSYPYLHLCDPSNHAYRVMSPALVSSYAGFHYPLYGKTAGREEADLSQSNNSSMNSKPPSDSTTLELRQHHNMPYHGKSPVVCVTIVQPGERGSPERERDLEQEREPVPYSQHLHTHHHTHLGMGYTLMPGQYDPYPGLSPTAVVSSQKKHNSSNESDGKM
ncbi:zinc finger protein 608 isoform X2 [Alosa sapidissima]|uniref:zinc finger protein 608 isoform X2 n=1 Tax=Alosa sapidissima TaxID=34773 RepID=UPI001C08394F|nr:zinc finger protein 608 isoform X2 [Alosa sapidissima]